MTITLCHPSRGRPKQAREALCLWTEKRGTACELYHVLSIDTGDPDAAAYMDQDWPSWTDIIEHENKTMVDALNRCLEFVEPGDLLVTLFDDMEPSQDWAHDFLQWAEHNNGLAHIDCVDTPNLQTVCAGHASIFKAWGHIYYPGYMSMFADNDYTERGAQLDELRQCNMSVKHRHPALGTAKNDQTYQRQNHTVAYQLGHNVLIRRRQRRFEW
jgi:hypothetical protein